jgi:signal peptidase I
MKKKAKNEKLQKNKNSQFSRLSSEEVFSVVRVLKKLQKGEIFRLKAVSESMMPLIAKGDELVLVKNDIGDVQKNDVIAFYSSENKKIIVHRAISVLTDKSGIRLITKGDNSEEKDLETIFSKDYLGKVNQVVRGKRKITNLGRKKHLFGFFQGVLSKKLKSFFSFLQFL